MVVRVVYGVFRGWTELEVAEVASWVAVVAWVLQDQGLVLAVVEVVGERDREGLVG